MTDKKVLEKVKEWLELNTLDETMSDSIKSDSRNLLVFIGKWKRDENN